jgi:hypothetical protein
MQPKILSRKCTGGKIRRALAEEIRLKQDFDSKPPVASADFSAFWLPS